MPRRDPLVLDLSGNGTVDTLSITAGVHFDSDNSGFAERTSWVAPDDALLVLDRNSNGFIDGGAELFGTDTLLNNGTFAVNGFDALAEFDLNEDGQIDVNDSIFSDLRLWQDTNSNGVTDSGEVKTLTAMGVTAVATTFTTNRFTDANRVDHREAGAFTKTDGTTGVTNSLWFESDRRATVAVPQTQGDNIVISDAIKRLPNALGSGNTYSLHQAIMLDQSGELRAKVEAFSAEPDLTKRHALVKDILVLWTGNQNITAGSRGTAVDAKEVSIMESFWGQAALMQNPNGQYAQSVNVAYLKFEQSVYAQLMVSGPAKELIRMITFSKVNGVWNGDFSSVSALLASDFAFRSIYAPTDLAELMAVVRGLNPYSTALYDQFKTSLEIEAKKLPADEQKTMQSVIRTGDDTLTGAETDDLIVGYEGHDTINAAAGNDVVYGGLGNDTLHGNNGDDTLHGGTGEDIIYGGEGNDYLYGGIENDRISGGSGNDILRGGIGNDSLSGDTGNDTYQFGYGDGQDTINNYDYSTGHNDVLRLHNAVTVADVKLTRSGDTLIITLISTGDKVTVNSHFTGDAPSAYSLTSIEFGDGTLWDYATIQTLSSTGTDGADYLVGDLGNNNLDGLAGNDILHGRAGNDVLRGGTGNDTLSGDAGSDTYLFGYGDGQETINNYDYSAGRSDILKLNNDVAVSDVKLTRSGDTLTVTLISTGDKVTVNSHFNGDAPSAYALTAIEFGDGTVWNYAAIQTISSTGSALADNLYGDLGNNILNGLAGNDFLYGRAANDVLRGGTGNDTLSGDAGSDTYLFGYGDGQDIINNYDTSALHSDLLKLDPNVTTADVKLTRSGDALIVTLISTGDKVTVSYHFNGDAPSAYSLAGIEFGDGTVWDYATIQTIATTGTNLADTLIGDLGNNTLDGLGGNDNLSGRAGNDVLRGGTGSDTLSGDAGSDTYLFGYGDGQDTINNYDYSAGHSDVLRLNNDVVVSDVKLTRSGDTLIVTLISTGDNVTINNHFNGDAAGTYSLSNITFGDGTVWNYATIQTIASTGTNLADTLIGDLGNNTLDGLGGNDNLSGRAGNDVLRGNTGNDTLSGDAGSDIYLFGYGDGQDTINNYDSSADHKDVLRFNSNVTTADVKLTRSGDGLIITLISTGDKVTVNNHFYNDAPGNYSLASLEFTDGTVWDYAAIQTKASTGTSLADTLIGDLGNNTLDGLDGNDTLSGRAGNDVLRGGIGNDTLSGDAGSDTYVFGYDDGQDTINNYDSSTGRNDVLRLRDGIAINDVKISRLNNDLFVTLLSTGDKVTVSNHFYTEAPSSYSLNSIVLGDGTVWNYAQIKTLASTGSEFADHLYGDSENNNLSGLGGNDNLYGLAGNDTLLGGSGNDTLNGDTGEDILDGGFGNDNLTGASGNDTYLFGKGDGQDTISYEYDTSSSKFNVLQFKDSVAPSEIIASRINGDLILSIAGTTDKVTIGYFFNSDELANAYNPIQQVKFADGTTWDIAFLATKVFEGTVGNDNISGTKNADTITGGLGNDTVSGMAGNDTLNGDA
ncbi:MAG: calcium-binding protein, partial [Pseudomonadota bacterium]